MSVRSRCGVLVVGLALVAAGCDAKSSSSGGGAGQPYGKKLVGRWEGSLDEKGEKPMPVTAEYNADNTFKGVFGPFAMSGTWKLVKEDGKTVTIETEAAPDEMKDMKQKTTLKLVFEDDDTLVMSKDGDRPDPVKMKRKK